METVKNSHESKKITYITPNAKDLLLNRILNCPESNCSVSFKNVQNLKMHLVKHHKLNLQEDNLGKDQTKLYHCPDVSCVYNKESGRGKFFSALKYVRQHYQKVHAEKNFKCEKCQKDFLSPAILSTHVKSCGKKHKCDECGWEYNSREALLTHVKRKSHKLFARNSNPCVSSNHESTKQANKVKIPIYDPSVKPIQIFVKISSELKDKAIQTDSRSSCTKKGFTKRKCSQDEVTSKRPKFTAKESYTKSSDYTLEHEEKPHLDFDIFGETGAKSEEEKKNLNNLSYGEDTMNSCFDQLVNSASFCHIETQTEFSTAILDQMLYSNSHTQTCDEFLSELGLADIQTQTNWSGTPYPSGRNNEATSSSGAHDELLVSTETQTSFTQCLLECNGSSTPGITQHTQTCDTLLEGLFGSQESDLIANFQSTHTQT